MARCNHDHCEHESESCCFDCSLTFCEAHSYWCPSCWNTVCLGCKALFHSGLTPTAHDHWSCGGWPMESLQQRTEFLARLLKIKSLRDLFIAFVRRRPFVFERRKIYVAITAQQRGDFHKFKWSIASNKQLVALLPLNATYDPAWLTDIIERARALDIMASGQWEFVHSTLFASKRRRDASSDEVFKLSGFDSKAFRARKIGLVDLDDPEEARALFAQWSLENGQKIYEINSLVPLYNAELTRKMRGEVLSSVMVFGSRPLEPAHQLIGLLAHLVMRNNVVVLWGSRTGGGVSKLNLEQPAREYRHKTGKGLVRLISATLRGRKVRILAGDPLTAVDADIDLTCMWDAKIMKQRFNIEYGFSRLEQEYVFYHLASIADNTLHIGMQSGNIETLINNPRTNVICVNENTKGGAGLVNVDKISARRDEQVGKGGPPCNLYLSYNLAVLPSALGQLTRMLMEKYGEMITLKHGLERLENEISSKKQSTPSLTLLTVQPLDPQPKPPEPLPISQLSLQPSSNQLSLQPSSDQLVASSPSKPTSKPGLLSTSSDEELAERLMLYLAGKRARSSELVPVTKSEIVPVPIPQDLRIEIRMLLALAASASQRVQYAIRCLNNVRLAPTRSPAELWLHVIAERVMQCPLYKLEKSQSDGEKGALSTAPRERARVLLEQMAGTIALLKQKSVDERPRQLAQYEKEYDDLKHAFDHVDDDEPKRLKLSVRHMSELSRDRSSALQAEWQKLLHCQPWRSEELEEMVPICVLLGIDPSSNKGRRPAKNDDDSSNDGGPNDGPSDGPSDGKPSDRKPSSGLPSGGQPSSGPPDSQRFEPRFLPSRSGQVYPLDYGLPSFANRIVPSDQIAEWYIGFQSRSRQPSRQLYEELERTITHLDWQIAEQEPDRDERAEFTHRTYPVRGRNQPAYQTWLRFKELIALRDDIFADRH
jgi:hypothetical protein